MRLNLEKTVKDWIDADPDGDGLTAYLEVPADRPQRFVTISTPSPPSPWKASSTSPTPARRPSPDTRSP